MNGSAEGSVYKKARGHCGAVASGVFSGNRWANAPEVQIEFKRGMGTPTVIHAHCTTRALH